MLSTCEETETFCDGEAGHDFGDLALKFVEEAIQECGDEPIPLILLQALILLTHLLLIQGVRGRAWRYLGLAIRAAYELNLHLIDARRVKVASQIPQQWVEDEERRRAWWAIWEMDVFASVIRRCPTGINWSQIETYLPIRDDLWAKGEPQSSCYLELNSNQRWKSLEASQNSSPKAWFLVISSLMKDAQTITSPTNIERDFGENPHSNPQSAAPKERFQKDHILSKESALRLCTIRNALDCALMALPSNLRYRGTYLSFGTRAMDRSRGLAHRQTDAAIYSIHFMSQLTKIMVAKGYFIGASKYPKRMNDHRPSTENLKPSSERAGFLPSSHEALDLALEAADEILFIVRRSCDDQFRYVNPFLASTIWFAGAIQLVYRQLRSSDATEKALMDSNSDFLRLSHQKFVSYWNLPVALRKNLEEIENVLRYLTLNMQKHPTGDHLGTKSPSNPHKKRNLTCSDGRSTKDGDATNSVDIAWYKNRRLPGTTAAVTMTDDNQQIKRSQPRPPRESVDNGGNPSSDRATDIGVNQANDQSLSLMSTPNAKILGGGSQIRNSNNQYEAQAKQSQQPQDRFQQMATTPFEASLDGLSMAERQPYARNGLPTGHDHHNLPNQWLESIDGTFYSPGFTDNALDLSTYLDSMYSGPFTDDLSGNGFVFSRQQE